MEDKDKQIADLTKKVATLEADSAKKDGDLQAATKVVEDLKKQLAEKKAGTVELPTVTVGKDTYELTSDFMYQGEEVTIDVLKENAKLAAELVKEKVGNLRKVGK